jgi:hypothetical protein
VNKHKYLTLYHLPIVNGAQLQQIKQPDCYRPRYNIRIMVDRTNEEWLADLKSDGPAKEAALVDLRATILAGLPYALSYPQITHNSNH